MEAIEKRRNLLAALLAAGLLLSGWFVLQSAAESAAVFGAMSTVLLVLLILQMRRLRDADLIRNNCILAVPSVDGVNAITGETAAPDQSGYVLEPYGYVEIAGWRGDFLEAEAFAFLAARHLRGLPLSLPGTTGVSAPQTGGRLARKP